MRGGYSNKRICAAIRRTGYYFPCVVEASQSPPEWLSTSAALKRYLTHCGYGDFAARLPKQSAEKTWHDILDSGDTLARIDVTPPTDGAAEYEERSQHALEESGRNLLEENVAHADFALVQFLFDNCLLDTIRIDDIVALRAERRMEDTPRQNLWLVEYMLRVTALGREDDTDLDKMMRDRAAFALTILRRRNPKALLTKLDAAFRKRSKRFEKHLRRLFFESGNASAEATENEHCNQSKKLFTRAILRNVGNLQSYATGVLAERHPGTKRLLTELLDMPSKDAATRCHNQLPFVREIARRIPQANFRELNMAFCDHRICVCSQAHPNQYGNNTEQYLKFLREARIRDVIQAKENLEEDLTAVLAEHGIACHTVVVEDMTAPTLLQVEEILYFVGKAAKKCQPVLVHCGEGWGRTGSVLAALWLLSDASLPRSDTTTLEMGHYNDNVPVHDVLPEVVAAVDFVRAFDAAHGSESRHEFGNTDGSSVERTAQVRGLEEVYRNRRAIRKRALFETFPRYFV